MRVALASTTLLALRQICGTAIPPVGGRHEAIHGLTVEAPARSISGPSRVSHPRQRRLPLSRRRARSRRPETPRPPSKRRLSSLGEWAWSQCLTDQPFVVSPCATAKLVTLFGEFMAAPSCLRRLDRCGRYHPPAWTSLDNLMLLTLRHVSGHMVSRRGEANHGLVHEL